MGKPLKQAKGEIKTMINRAESLLKIAPSLLEDDIISIDSENILKICKEPIGASLIISPWNYPLLCSISAIIPSIICGNSVLLKHSPRTPMVGEFFEEAFNSVGALNVVQNLFLKNSDVEEVYKYPLINFVGFTGSVEGGKAVLMDIARHGRFIRTNFELGGKDAAYVREDADLDFAVENVIDGAMYNSGQSCCAVERAYIHESIYDEFIEKASNLISNYKLGNPLDETTTIGPQALPDSSLFLQEQVEEAVSEGARVICGGRLTTDSNGKGRFFEPTLIVDCNNDMNIMRRESFGPILPIMKVSEDDEAIEAINNSEFGLTASIFSKDYKNALELAKRVNILNINLFLRNLIYFFSFFRSILELYF
jgi:acyl-CoA reductase-like NAD-dependent aldehyde dehydrogenase